MAGSKRRVQERIHRTIKKTHSHQRQSRTLFQGQVTKFQRDSKTNTQDLAFRASQRSHTEIWFRNHQSTTRFQTSCTKLPYNTRKQREG